MTRFYCPLPVELNAVFALPAAAARHAQVLRLQPGDPIQLFDGLGGAWRGEVMSMGRQEVQARALAPRAVQARPQQEVTLAVGMPANERMDWLVEKATELGVTRLVPLVTERTVVRLQGERASKRVAHWQAIAAGATFVARTTHTNPNHVLQMMEAAMDHDGFSFIECLSECVEFYPGAFDGANPRKGGQFPLVPEDHDVTDEYAAYKLSEDLMPGKFGIFYKVSRATKNANEAKIISTNREKFASLKDWQILQKNFDRMK